MSQILTRKVGICSKCLV